VHDRIRLRPWERGDVDFRGKVLRLAYGSPNALSVERRQRKRLRHRGELSQLLEERVIDGDASGDKGDGDGSAHRGDDDPEDLTVEYGERRRLIAGTRGLQETAKRKCTADAVRACRVGGDLTVEIEQQHPGRADAVAVVLE